MPLTQSTLAAPCPTADDVVRYAAAITQAWREMPAIDDARKLRIEIIRALERLARYGARSTGVSRSNMRHLIRLVALVRPEDLVNNGGLLGASNGWYAERLGVQAETMTTIFRALKKAGLIIPHNPSGNHRRVARRKHDGSWKGRGYSLMPLVVRLPALAAEGMRLEREVTMTRAKCSEARQLLRTMRAQLALEADADLQEQFESLQRASEALPPSPTMVAATDLLHAVFSLSLAVEKHVLTYGEHLVRHDQIQDQPGNNSGRHHTTEQDHTVPVSAQQEGGSGKGFGSSKASGQDEMSLGNSAAREPGALSCKLTLGEAHRLLPAASPLLPPDLGHDACLIAASDLGNALRINPRLLARSYEVMGIGRTMWSLALVRQRAARGEILASPAAYFNGMVSKAIAGKLDIDRSIWGERQRNAQFSTK